MALANTTKACGHQATITSSESLHKFINALERRSFPHTLRFPLLVKLFTGNSEDLCAASWVEPEVLGGQPMVSVLPQPLLVIRHLSLPGINNFTCEVGSSDEHSWLLSHVGSPKFAILDGRLGAVSIPSIYSLTVGSFSHHTLLPAVYLISQLTHASSGIAALKVLEYRLLVARNSGMLLKEEGISPQRILYVLGRAHQQTINVVSPMLSLPSLEPLHGETFSERSKQYPSQLSGDCLPFLKEKSNDVGFAILAYLIIRPRISTQVKRCRIEQLSPSHLDAGENASEKEGEMEVDTEALTEATTSSNVPRPQPQASKPNLCPSKPTLAPNSHHPKPKPPLIRPSKPIVRIYASTAFGAAELKPLSTSLPPIVSSRIWRLSINSAENRPPYDYARPSLTYLPFTINSL
ncbi:hypothetical protein NP233_g9460 [Leucocoprinus birnbaumii]|uniref:Uncharacterized protein n=1 Tax=Leucocoprinus birnbaumii TaxID=56174 RepID=A0AAD5YSU5_9AGAR|nr:hypothetical protein NP233_g9460 [Leucocoprinus birnbaumii]